MRRLKLNQFLMKTGLFDKKEDVIKAIHKGLILVDEKIVKDTDFGVKNKHVIKYRGEILELVSKNIYLVLNKPKGCLCQKGAEHNVYKIIKQIKDFSPEEKQSLFIVGRLDKDTTGLLILSNDGKLADKIMKPNKKVVKTYVALLDKELLDKDKASIEKGVEIIVNDKEYVTKPSKIVFVDENKRKVSISIYEGKKRQIRKMFIKLGYNIIELERVSIGNLKLGNLKSGDIPIEDYSLELAHNTLGEKEKDNGLLILLAVDDRNYRIEVGYGLEPTIPDALAGRIGNEKMSPLFKEGNYEQGLFDGVLAISAVLKGDESWETTGSGAPKMDSGTIKLSFWVLFIIIIIISNIIAGYKHAKKKTKGKGKKGGRPDTGDFMAAWIIASMFGRGGRGGGGLGGGGMGGFGGFGGGGFGGGGFSGRF